MPRNLFSSDQKDTSIVQSPEAQTPKADHKEVATATDEGGYNEFTIHRDESREQGVQLYGNRAMGSKEKDNLHPYTQTLSISNLESCVALENAIFPEHERCSKEKFIYRLNTCPELCFGIFSTTTTPPESSESTSPTPFSTAHPAYSADPDKKSVLIAMIIATKTSAPSVTDASLSVPENPSTQPTQPQSNAPSSQPQQNDHVLGHIESGRTICIHTLGVLPTYQGRGLAKTIMRAYQQRMETSGIGDRIALLAHEHLVGMYEGMGFADKGRSDVQFGGGGWTNLVYEFSEHGLGMSFGT